MLLVLFIQFKCSNNNFITLQNFRSLKNWSHLLTATILLLFAYQLGILLSPLQVNIVTISNTDNRGGHLLVFGLDYPGMSSKERLRAPQNQQRRDSQLNMNALVDEETQRSTELMEELDTENEVKYFSMII